MMTSPHTTIPDDSHNLEAREAIISKRIDQALGREPADLVIKNVTIVNVANGSLSLGDIAICGDTIIGTYDRYKGNVEIDGAGLFAAPGFIDAHLHVESSLLTPGEFDRLVLPRGTTTAICDPHEISNVLGEEGLRYFLDSSKHLLMDLFVQLSSCVPATQLETSGGTLNADTLRSFRDHPRTLGLAEFMNIGGVLGHDPDTTRKLAVFQGRHIDGHLPGISGFALNAMLSCGIRTCHESVGKNEAEEKLKKGVIVLIREGSVCKDLQALSSMINLFTAKRLAFCTDDLKPNDIIRNGHIDNIIRKAIRLGTDPLVAYHIATLSAAEAFGLPDRGLIAPGRRADIVLLSDLNTASICSVIKNGAVVSEASFERRRLPPPVGYKSVHIRKVHANDFVIETDDRKAAQPVIGIIRGQIITESLSAILPHNDQGQTIADPKQDILKIAVLERHGKNGNISISFVKGFGIIEGAIASTHGHDSHNIIVIGSDDESMALAVNTIYDMQGGFTVIQNGKVTGRMSLPIAGLMSDQPYETVSEELSQFRQSLAELGAKVDDPVLQMAFLALCVIPNLKLTDHGLVRFSPQEGDLRPTLVRDQRGQNLGMPAPR
jgi:adenine deaminase